MVFRTLHHFSSGGKTVQVTSPVRIPGNFCDVTVKEKKTEERGSADRGGRRGEEGEEV